LSTLNNAFLVTGIVCCPSVLAPYMLPPTNYLRTAARKTGFVIVVLDITLFMHYDFCAGCLNVTGCW